MKMARIKKRPSLADVLAYQNPMVVAGFIKTFAVPQAEADDIFEQLKCMLWLTNEMEYDGLRESGKIWLIDRSLLVLDEMWHNFILFTAPYFEFCISQFGYYIHHVPTVDEPEKKAARAAEFAALTHEQTIAKVMDEKRWQYNYVFSKLGKERFVKWYTEYHQKYTDQYLVELRAMAIANKRAAKRKVPGVVGAALACSEEVAVVRHN
jgi:hypothetical protein